MVCPQSISICVPSKCVCAVYPDGRVCISILHTPGEDPLGYEKSSERWSPVQSIEKILLSVVSMLAGMREMCCALEMFNAASWCLDVQSQMTRVEPM